MLRAARCCKRRYRESDKRRKLGSRPLFHRTGWENGYVCFCTWSLPRNKPSIFWAAMKSMPAFRFVNSFIG